MTHIEDKKIKRKSASYFEDDMVVQENKTTWIHRKVEIK